MEGTFKANKIITIFEHDCDNPNIFHEIDKDYWFWRESCGYVQIWLFSGLVYDVIKRDECRFMYE